LGFFGKEVKMGEKTEAQKKAQKKYMEKFMVAQIEMERDKLN